MDDSINQMEVCAKEFTRSPIRWREIRLVAVGLVTGAATWACRAMFLPGTRIREIALAAGLSGGLYVLLAGRYCVLPEHQTLVVTSVRARAPFLEWPIGLWLGTRRRTSGQRLGPSRSENRW
jgi:hypothetical protein